MKEEAAAKNILIVPMINACCVIHYKLATSPLFFSCYHKYFLPRKHIECVYYLVLFRRFLRHTNCHIHISLNNDLFSYRHMEIRLSS
jgi:hypothetical protein